MGGWMMALSKAGGIVKESTKSHSTREAEAKGGKEKGGGGMDMMAEGSKLAGSLKSFHRGGTVRKTGPARLKRGERVLTKRQAKTYRKRMPKG